MALGGIPPVGSNTLGGWPASEPSTSPAGSLAVQPDRNPMLPVAPPGSNALSPKDGVDKSTTISPSTQAGKVECKTCEQRKYQDESNDSSVSFQTPTSLSTDQAPAAVMAHEQEHVINEQQRAGQEGRRVLSQSVRIHTATCPECGRVYVAGGETKTVTADDPKALERETTGKGQVIDDYI
ncbi:hypothetical protein [Heliophilum fasciatum]|uniref:Uncharacterized protein n=1 Tax=Heliophilum fasciatum TaxID=35700 RepID=A0A4R2RC89_9FIRM|nr:hypothetical protein [Heliophilum fasciatum]MCW2279193.1 uncharacterized Zn finger protein (UPF0148 family) [Heliophilum fasciatum]TCP60982.1 hypothetical protein EDD73_1328 [Heliophilum fasciatum]